MTLDESRHLVRRLFRQALQADATPAEGPHPLEDEELLACWETGLLAPHQLEDIREHLEGCPSCYSRLGQLLRTGRLALPEAPVARSPWRRVFIGVALAGAVAAGILIVLFVGSRPDAATTTLARSEQALDAGHPSEALRMLESLSDDQVPTSQRERFHADLERAGFGTARAQLNGSQFAEVGGLVQRLHQRGIQSARLENLALQAERHLPAETTLAYAGSLVDLGYELDGFSPRKGLPVLDPAIEKQEHAWARAVEEHPDDLTLRLNRASYLLVRGRLEQAQEQFTEAARRAPDAAAPRLGQGLAAFQLQDFPVALSCFRAALERQPESTAALLNTAVCLERLGRHAEALPLWRRLRDGSTDPSLRQAIDAHLAQEGR